MRSAWGNSSGSGSAAFLHGQGVYGDAYGKADAGRVVVAILTGGLSEVVKAVDTAVDKGVKTKETKSLASLEPKNRYSNNPLTAKLVKRSYSKVGKKAAAKWNKPYSSWPTNPVADMAPEDMLLSLADGSWPGMIGTAAFQNLEYRATIKGGLLALARAGVLPWASEDMGRKITALKVKDAGQTNSQDDALTSIVGLSGHKQQNLKDAAERVRKWVRDAHVSDIAWATRGTLILQGIPKYAAAHGVAVAVLAAIPITSPFSVIGSAHMAAEKAASTAILGKFDTIMVAFEAEIEKIKGRLTEEEAKKIVDESEKKADDAEKEANEWKRQANTAQNAPQLPAIASMPLWKEPLFLGAMGALVLVGGFALLRSRE